VPDISSPLVLDALRRAAADPAGSLLFCQKANPGLFGTSVSARQAAQKCKELKLLEVVRSEPRGKSVQEVVVLTPKGMEHLLSRSDPRLLLEDLIRTLETREKQWSALSDAVHQTQASLTAFKEMTASVLGSMSKVGNPSPPSTGAARADLARRCLATWNDGNPAEDCPLPRLFRDMQATDPELTNGLFHDLLRKLHLGEQIYLHPWTGPLCEMPEPGMALLVGHEVAYYASLRP
jgi:hypothetical protein